MTKNTHTVTLERLCFTGSLQDLLDESDFNLVIDMDNRKIVYSGCNWVEAAETMSGYAYVMEWAELEATRRMEIA